MNGTTLSVVIALTLALFAVALTLIYLADESVRRRLSFAGGGRRSADQPVQSEGLSWLVRLGERIQETRKTKAEDLSQLRLQLLRAGIYNEYAPAVFSAVRV